jgi:hypothetical protein
MTRGTTKHVCVGKRVEIPVYTDMWMRGARFGTITRVIIGKGSYLDPKDVRGLDIFVVALDHTQIKTPHQFIADDCTWEDLKT